MSAHMYFVGRQCGFCEEKAVAAIETVKVCPGHMARINEIAKDAGTGPARFRMLDKKPRRVKADR